MLERDIKLREFNFKVLHGILPCKKNLKQWKVKNSELWSDSDNRTFTLELQICLGTLENSGRCTGGKFRFQHDIRD